MFKNLIRIYKVKWLATLTVFLITPSHFAFSQSRSCSTQGLSCRTATQAYYYCLSLKKKNNPSLSTARYCRTRICQIRRLCQPQVVQKIFSQAVRRVQTPRMAFQQQVIPTQRPLGADASPCSRLPSCSGNAYVKVDINANCMCVGPTCFRVGVGANKNWNPTGTARLKAINRPDGAGKYQTNRKTTQYRDDDAIALDIPGVWGTGKWFHKSGNCTSHWRTEGCVAIPCSMWPLVKSSLGKKATVCRGSSSSQPGRQRRSNISQ